MQTFKKPKHAVLKRFVLHLSDGKDVVMHNIKVIKDSQRHLVHLVGNPVQIDLVRVKKEERLKVLEGIQLLPIEGTNRWEKIRDYVWGQYSSERCEIYAFSNDIGLGATAVTALPAFIERLLM